MLRASREGATLLLTIDRPEAGNSINAEAARALNAAVAEAAQDESLRALVIAGAGERFFCTGGDIKEYRHLADRDALNDIFRHCREALRGLETLDVPVIAAIDGYALGGGLELALAADIRIAGPNAQFGLPQSRLGIIPGWHGIERLTRDFGRGLAIRLAASGERFDARQALAWGLVDEVTDGSTALERAMAVAGGFSKSAPLALKAVKRVAMAATADWQAASELSEDLFASLWFTEDHRAAEAAFAEKREPAFKGR